MEVRRISDDSLLGTLDHTASPLCSTGTTQRIVNEDISAYVTSTDIANDLRIKVFGYETGLKAWNIDYSTVTGTSYASWTLFQRTIADAADGSAANTTWSLSNAEATGAGGTIYTAASNWPSAAPVGTKFLQFKFDQAGLPAGAVVQSVTLKHIWRASALVTNSGLLCNYFEVYDGATLIGTHGGNTQPTALSCTASNVTWITDTVALPEVNTVAEANGLTVKFYYWMAPLCGGAGNPNCVKSVSDQVRGTYNYYLD